MEVCVTWVRPIRAKCGHVSSLRRERSRTSEELGREHKIDREGGGGASGQNAEKAVSFVLEHSLRRLPCEEFEVLFAQDIVV